MGSILSTAKNKKQTNTITTKNKKKKKALRAEKSYNAMSLIFSFYQYIPYLYAFQSVTTCNIYTVIYMLGTLFSFAFLKFCCLFTYLFCDASDQTHGHACRRKVHDH
jgi:hypothetical protein